MAQNIVLIIGSAPDALLAQKWDLSMFTHRVVINNAWQITPEWNFLVCPEDFPEARLPRTQLKSHQQLIAAPDFVPQQNSFGGFVYAGGTMAFTTAYWALGALKPDVIAFIGCDMVYDQHKGAGSHFYGHGTADPLRVDVTLQSLEAKSMRFMAMANTHQCSVVNLSALPESRLLFPRVSLFELDQPKVHHALLRRQRDMLDLAGVAIALQAEEDLGYMVPSGRYWEHENDFDESKLSDIDGLWLQVMREPTAVNT